MTQRTTWSQGPLGLSLAVALACPTAFADAGGERVMQNDSGSGTVVCPCFVAGEHAAAWLTAPCGGTLRTVQIGWGSVMGGSPPSLEREIHIYRSGGFPNPGAEITNGELLGPVLEDGFINEFDVSFMNIVVAEGETIVVSLEFDNDSPPLGPSTVHDGDGCQAGKNTVFVLPNFAWFNVCSLGLTGDWLIRAVLVCGEEKDECPEDLNGNGEVEFGDILALLAVWGQKDRPEDLDGDGFVGFNDLIIVLAAWGPCP